MKDRYLQKGCFLITRCYRLLLRLTSITFEQIYSVHYEMNNATAKLPIQAHVMFKLILSLTLHQPMTAFAVMTLYLIY